MNDRATHHVYLIPGLFGFGKLAGYDYFEHLEVALAARFAQAGRVLHMEVVPAPPTASIPLRATIVARTVASTSSGDDGPIHLLGHSTGGLDARLLVAPGITLPATAEELAWTARVKTVVTLNTPHYGTPLAGYFTTAAGTRFLYALSLFTVGSLSFGKLPLSFISNLLSAIKGFDRKLGFQIKVLEDLTDQLLRFAGPAARDEIADYLRHVKGDQGGIIQLMPEVMELFNACVVDAPGVRYGCIATAAPAPGARLLWAALRRPLRAAQLGIYAALYGFASRAAQRYPYAVPLPEQADLLAKARLMDLGPASTDGVVPTLSMLRGELVWCGAGDHLDVVGHFGGSIAEVADSDEPAAVRSKHVDWLQSGSSFDRSAFAAMVDKLTAFLLRAS